MEEHMSAAGASIRFPDPVTLVVVALLVAPGCALTREATVPMPQVDHFTTSTTTDASGRTLVVMLPGYGDGPGHFSDHGFVRAVTEHSDTIDVIAVDAHYGYYRTMTVVERLERDVIVPARTRGYQRIWLVGVSMGGFGSLAYLQQHSDSIAGVIVLAPYLGDSDLIEEISDAGGLSSWNPDEVEAVEGDRSRFFRSLWSWLKRRPANSPPIFIGVGEDDRLEPASRLISATLPKGQVRVRDGGHGWSTWEPLFRSLLEASTIATGR
ncbi:MAG: pimeloyl-ACP methyl ester carboxylesterase [Myxococcota bacterium]|jgi:pimeloyl-ACP methyl ester carboxylesterase